jgi:hypothetical protein
MLAITSEFQKTHVYDKFFFFLMSRVWPKRGTSYNTLAKIIGLFPYYSIYLQVFKLDGLTVNFV